MYALIRIDAGGCAFEEVLGRAPVRIWHPPHEAHNCAPCLIACHQVKNFYRELYKRQAAAELRKLAAPVPLSDTKLGKVRELLDAMLRAVRIDWFNVEAHSVHELPAQPQYASLLGIQEFWRRLSGREGSFLGAKRGDGVAAWKTWFDAAIGVAASANLHDCYFTPYVPPLRTAAPKDTTHSVDGLSSSGGGGAGGGGGGSSSSSGGGGSSSSSSSSSSGSGFGGSARALPGGGSAGAVLGVVNGTSHNGGAGGLPPRIQALRTEVMTLQAQGALPASVVSYIRYLEANRASLERKVAASQLPVGSAGGGGQLVGRTSSGGGNRSSGRISSSGGTGSSSGSVRDSAGAGAGFGSSGGGDHGSSVSHSGASSRNGNDSSGSSDNTIIGTDSSSSSSGGGGGNSGGGGCNKSGGGCNSSGDSGSCSSGGSTANNNALSSSSRGGGSRPSSSIGGGNSSSFSSSFSSSGGGGGGSNNLTRASTEPSASMLDSGGLLPAPSQAQIARANSNRELALRRRLERLQTQVPSSQPTAGSPM